MHTIFKKDKSATHTMKKRMATKERNPMRCTNGLNMNNQKLIIARRPKRGDHDLKGANCEIVHSNERMTTDVRDIRK